MADTSTAAAASDTTTAATASTTAASTDASTTTSTEATKAVDVALYDENTLAGDHTNQVFGNVPANPKTPDNLRAADDVRLTRTTPDHPGGPVTCYVHPDMVGDYMRAGWNLPDGETMPK